MTETLARPDLLVPSYIERLTPYRPGKSFEELRRELGIEKAVKLASNENAIGRSPRVDNAISRALNDVHRYPDAQCFALRQALARHHNLSADDILVGNGSNEIIDLICRTFAEPGADALIGWPSFIYYPIGIQSANLQLRTAPLRDDIHWDVDLLSPPINDRTRLIFIDTPNNPTGSHLTPDALRALLSVVPRHTIVVIDEAYAEYADSDVYQSAVSLRDLHPRLIILRTFSKAYGLAGLRVGYAIAPPQMIDFLNRVRAPFNVNSLAQAAALAALEDQEHLSTCVELNRKERARVTASLTTSGLTVAPSQGNFVLVQVGPTAAEIYQQLLERGVIIRPVAKPLAQWLRMSIGTPEENDYALRHISEVVAARAD